MLAGRKIFLVVSGGIAAYKSLDLIRRLQDRGATVRCCLTAAAREFVTPMSVSALSKGPVYMDQFSLKDESEMGHIELSRQSDLLVVAPATANILARMAGGMADELATTLLLATDKPVLAAPAMNVRMWLHAATQANVATLKARGIRFVGPGEGAMACNEFGPGRLAEVPDIISAIETILNPHRPLAGKRAVVTSGPTIEPIDPVRFIANRSSGKQGHAIAAALAALGAEVTLVSGPTALPDPAGVTVAHVETAREMLAACQAALPAEIAVCAAAVADWGVEAIAGQKLKKEPGGAPPAIRLVPNPDILATLSAPGDARPRLVVGFAAETEKLVEHATAKRARKGCDWIVANDVSAASGTFGGDVNRVTLITPSGCEPWPADSKQAVAARLADRIAEALS